MWNASNDTGLLLDISGCAATVLSRAGSQRKILMLLPDHVEHVSPRLLACLESAQTLNSVHCPMRLACLEVQKGTPKGGMVGPSSS